VSNNVNDTPQPDQVEISTAVAREALERDARHRVEQAGREIQAILDRYQCVMRAVIVLTDGNQASRVEIVAQ